VRQLPLLELASQRTGASPVDGAAREQVSAPLVPDVPGLSYVPEYVTAEEERALLEAIDREPWLTDWQRRRQIHGLSYGSARGEPQTVGPLPSWVLPLAERVRREGRVEDEIANVVVNEYLPGQGIGLHHDYPGFGETVVAVSLGSACLLDLVLPGEGRAAVLDVAPRSLWVLGGDARRDWQHGIAHRKTDVVAGRRRPRGRRVSVTMRTARRGP
jgi:alkylated DNA repair dioxygenase AlkB